MQKVSRLFDYWRYQLNKRRRLYTLEADYNTKKVEPLVKAFLLWSRRYQSIRKSRLIALAQHRFQVYGYFHFTIASL